MRSRSGAIRADEGLHWSWMKEIKTANSFPFCTDLWIYGLILCALLSGGLAATTEHRSPETIEMARLLKEVADNVDPAELTFANSRRLEMFRQLLAEATNPKDIYDLNAEIARELLLSGNPQAAAIQFENLPRLARRFGYTPPSRVWTEVQFNHALSYIRLGELENCISNHTTMSCIAPIAPEGVHKFQRGSRQAIQMLEQQLSRKRTEHWDLRWLLNIAYMTVGEYPQKVPKQWLIPPSVFNSAHDIKRFTDIAGSLGLDVNDTAGGTVVDDFDNDGFLDVLTSEWTVAGPMHFFRSNGKGGFVDETEKAGLTGLTGGLNMLQADYNNDGLLDVLVLRGAWGNSGGNHPDSLLRNDGNGHFTDVTIPAGLLVYAPNQTAAWFDYNNDGWLDIFFAYESSGSNAHPCRLYRNNKDGTFTECAAQAGLDVRGYIKGVVSADYNNDRLPDLYLSLLDRPNMLFRNDGPDPADTNKWRFTETAAQAGVTEPRWSFPVFFFDLNNDGWEDLFACGYQTSGNADIALDYLGRPNNGSKARLYLNNKNGTFKDISEAAGIHKVLLGMGANYGDLDNDGWLDVYIGTGDPSFATLIPNRAFRNDAGRAFQDVTTSGGFGHLQKGHGVSFADLDHDGDQDIYHSVGGAYEGDFYRNVLFENPGHGNNFIYLKLEGAESNRGALGARIKLVIEENGAAREIHRTVSSGGSFGANPLRVEIGLGKAPAVKRLEVFWPTSGKTQALSGLEMKKMHRIVEGSPQPQTLAVTPAPFAKKHSAHDHHHH